MKDRTEINKNIPSSYKPKYVPVRCVVCNGFGTLKFGELKCHACEGKGYILVPVKEGGEGRNDY